MHGECHGKLVCVSQFSTVSSFCCRHSMSRTLTCALWSLTSRLLLCHLPQFGSQNPCFNSSASPGRWLKVSSTITFVVFSQHLVRFLRVDTTEAQSLSNWIEIVKGRDRREAQANHPTSRHYAGDKLTSSGLVKAMCVEALCQAVPCGTRDCKESLISITWSDVRVALPDLDQAWQQALHGLKELSTHTHR